MLNKSSVKTIKNEFNDKKQKSKIKWLRFLPAIAWMCVIFYSSSQTGEDVGRLLPLVQSIFPFITSFNFMHIVTYFILAMTLDFAFEHKGRLIKYKALIVLICLIYGVTDEIHQMFVGGRTPDIIDVRNDGIGAILWVLCIEIKPLNKIWCKLTYQK